MPAPRKIFNNLLCLKVIKAILLAEFTNEILIIDQRFDFLSAKPPPCALDFCSHVGALYGSSQIVVDSQS